MGFQVFSEFNNITDLFKRNPVGSSMLLGRRQRMRAHRIWVWCDRCRSSGSWQIEGARGPARSIREQPFLSCTSGSDHGGCRASIYILSYWVAYCLSQWGIISHFLIVWCCLLTVGYTMDTLYFAWLESPVDVDDSVRLAQFTLVDKLLYDCSQNYTAGKKSVLVCTYKCGSINHRAINKDKIGLIKCGLCCIFALINYSRLAKQSVWIINRPK